MARTIHISELRGKTHAAIITIRHDEYDAVERWLPDCVSVEGGNCNYEMATIEDDDGRPVKVVLTRCPDQGNLAAQAVANNVITDLNPGWIMLVGIAGAVPDYEFSLGDIVVASRLHDFSFSSVDSSGKISYETGGGPVHPDVERFLQTKIGRRNREKLLQISGLKRNEEFKTHPLVFESERDLSKRLYGDKDHTGKVRETILKRFPDGQRFDGVRVWSGPCANGNIVLKNHDLLMDWQNSARQVIDVETELAGVYRAARSAGEQNYPVLAIRGLSDVIGLKRDPDWTGYACTTAGAFAYAVLKSGFIDFSKNLPNPDISEPLSITKPEPLPQPGGVSSPVDFQKAPSRLWKSQTKPGAVFEGRDGVLADLDAAWDCAVKNTPGRARIISLVAIGGAGKTTVASRWKDALLERENHGDVERYFDWSFYSQGSQREGDGAGAQTEATSTDFMAKALKFFGDDAMAEGTEHPWDKGARLAELIGQHRTLLVLDGLEPLQHPVGPQEGELKDDGISGLFEGLRGSDSGLCLVTTREVVRELVPYEETTTPSWHLDSLTDKAGAAVLRGHGVTGPQEDLEEASREVKGHALTLSLMGRYMKMAFDRPDISKRDCFRFEDADAEFTNGHAFRVFEAYERWFESEGRNVELAILRLLGLFDRPATPDCISALCEEPAIAGLTEPLIGLTEQKWNIALNHLRDLDLIELDDWSPVKVMGYDEAKAQAAMEGGRRGKTPDIGPPQTFEIRNSSFVIRNSIDAHPVLREYFEKKLKEITVLAEAHGRLYEYLCSSVPYWPEGREGLLPLYQAVAHGCKAGRYQTVCLEVYHNRILRGTAGSHAFYSSNKLGLLSLDLAAVACFFTNPWKELAGDISSEAQTWLLSEAAFRLRALNRLIEAREPYDTAVIMCIEKKDWLNASIYSGNLSELELLLGNVADSVEAGAGSVEFADKSRDEFQRMGKRTTHADALHQAGESEKSRRLFEQAEGIQEKFQRDYPLLYSLQGYRYCDLLLATAEKNAWHCGAALGSARKAAKMAAPQTNLEAVEKRVKQTLAWVTPQRWLLDIALDNLTLGRVHLLRAILQDSDSHISPAREYLEEALNLLRESNSSDDIPRGLLPCAWMHVLAKEWDEAKRRLDEAWSIATRGGDPEKNWEGGMRLFIIDTLLHRARLFGKRDEYPWPDTTPAKDLAEAERLIEICGYHRRDEELADAKKAR